MRLKFRNIVHVLINDAEEESVTQRATRTLCHSAPLTLLCRFTWATHTRPRPDESFDEVLGGDKYKEGELWSCVYDNDLETRWSGGRQFSCTDEYNLNIKPFCISQNRNELHTFVCTFESPYFTLRFRTFRIRFSLPHCGFTALLFADLKDLACPDNTLYKNSW